MNHYKANADECARIYLSGTWQETGSDENAAIATAATMGKEEFDQTVA